MLIFDCHLDLAMNAVEWNRDLTRPIGEIRAREAKLRDKPDRARGTVCLPEMRRGGVGLCVATQIARIELGASPVAGWRSPAQAWAVTQAQRAWYEAMVEAGELASVRNLSELEAHVERWSTSAPEVERGAVGFILSLEGADSLVTLRHLERAVSAGLRAVGPAHYGPGVYAFGTDASGGFNERGRELLKEMDRLGLILDATHLCDECFWEALKLFQGPIWASHSNCRAIVPHNRQFSDDQIRALIERGAVIGGALDAWMLAPGWVRGTTTPESAGVRLDTLIRHVDHICQLAGNARHVGIGTDLDGAFGREQSPSDLETIADIVRLPGLLAGRGYTAEDCQGFASGNFLRFLREAWAKRWP